MAEPDAAVHTLLSSVSGLTGSGNGQNLYLGPERAVEVGRPRKCVSVVPSGGETMVMVGGAKRVRTHLVQVSIRSDQYDYATGLTLARACRDAVHKATVSGYVYCYVEEGEPRFTGVDEQESYHWEFTARLVSAA